MSYSVFKNAVEKISSVLSSYFTAFKNHLYCLLFLLKLTIFVQFNKYLCVSDVHLFMLGSVRDTHRK